ncbi:MAG TPA: hypothetical protein VLF59_06170 [Candidatus Saccharimonadales bacterium]|nr:hypothetical protein [Candidatus Saccharimonadales bacterium]
MDTETLPRESPEVPEQLGDSYEAPQPIPSPAAELPSSELPYYALDEAQIRAKITRALIEAEEHKAEAIAAGEGKPQSLFVLVTYEQDQKLKQESGQRVDDIDKARAMAEAERPYRDRAARVLRRADKILESVPNPESWWAAVSHPGKLAKAAGVHVRADMLLQRGQMAVMMAGLEFDKMMEAAKPYMPRVDVSEAVSAVAEVVHPAKHRAQTPETSGLSTEISPETQTLVEQLRLDNQLAEQLQILSNATVLTRLSSGELGIVGEDGTEYPAPTSAQIHQLVERRLPLVERKASQGFTRMLMVPKAVGVPPMVNNLRQSTLTHYAAGNLHDSAGAPMDIGRYYSEHPDDYNFIDAPGQLGTIEDADNGQEKSATPGWEVVMVKNMPECPSAERDIVVFGDRGEFTVGPRTPKEALRALQESPACIGERGFDIDTWLLFALTEMERDGMMVDAHGGTMLLGSATSGKVFKNGKNVPWIGWGSQYSKGDGKNWRKVDWGSAPARIRQYALGVRTSVALS